MNCLYCNKNCILIASLTENSEHWLCDSHEGWKVIFSLFLNKEIGSIKISSILNTIDIIFYYFNNDRKQFLVLENFTDVLSFPYHPANFTPENALEKIKMYLAFSNE